MKVWVHMRRPGKSAQGPVWRKPFEAVAPASIAPFFSGKGGKFTEYVEICADDGSKIRYSRKETR